MHIWLTAQAERLAEADCRIVFSARLENGKLRYETEDGKTVATLGEFVWIDGEHDEEEKFRRSIGRVLRYCADNDAKTAAIDLSASDDAFFITGILSEEVERFTAENDSADPSATFIVRIPLKEGPTLDGFRKEVSDETTVEQSFGDPGDPLQGRFEKFRKDLGSAEVPFGLYLKDLIDRKGVKRYPSGYPVNSTVYKAAGISKDAFSKIITLKVKHPDKGTVAALAIGLRLDLEEAEEMYIAAGHYLGKTEFLDKVIRFFIKEQIYDIDEVNYCLYAYNRPLLGERQPRENGR